MDEKEISAVLLFALWMINDCLVERLTITKIENGEMN